MSAASSGSRREGATPSMLDLVQLSRRALFPPGGQDLYRQIAILTEMKKGDEVLVAACGRGITLEYFAREFGVQGSGVDDDEVLIEGAEAQARDEGLRNRMQFQHTPMHNLPYRDGVFDVVVGELGLINRSDPGEAILELARVLRPGGRIALVQLVWTAPVGAKRQALLSRYLGARPVMLVELKRILREAGIARLHTEVWSDEETAFRRGVKKPFPDFSDLFSLPEKLAILRRAWSRWGLGGVRRAFGRETEVHRMLTKERVLGLDMIMGTREELAHSVVQAKGRQGFTEIQGAPEGVLGIDEGGSEEVEAGGQNVGAGDHEAGEEPSSSDAETEGLPLFGRGEER